MGDVMDVNAVDHGGAMRPLHRHPPPELSPRGLFEATRTLHPSALLISGVPNIRIPNKPRGHSSLLKSVS